MFKKLDLRLQANRDKLLCTHAEVAVSFVLGVIVGCIFFALTFASSYAQAAPLADYTFKSPSFNGNGYSSHVLTIENQERTRRDNIRKEIQAGLDKAKNDANNTNVAKFLNNLESRIYAQISQNLATEMFEAGGATNGTLNFEGNIINWTRTGTEITLNVTDYLGSTTAINIPLGQWQF